MSLEEAEAWPDLLAIVREEVKPERDKLKDNADGAHRKKYWWLFGRWTPALFSAIAPLERCLVTTAVSKHRCFSFVDAKQIFDQRLFVFSLDSFSCFSVLQSRVHISWSDLFGSSLRSDPTYAASRCFETFPFPKIEPRTAIPQLESIGKALNNARAKFMVDTDQGLTKTYNAMKDPACDDTRVLELRRLSEEMDRAVLDAYGWRDIVVPPYCPMNDADKRALAAFEDEVIDRLYLLNAERAREEERLGLPKKGGKKSKRAKSADEAEATSSRSKKASAKKRQGDLF